MGSFISATSDLSVVKVEAVREEQRVAGVQVRPDLSLLGFRLHGVGHASASRCRLVGDVEAGLTKKVEIRGEERTVTIRPNALKEFK